MLTETNFQQEDLPAQPEQEPAPESVFVLPPLAGFWRRFFAWLLDSILLGVTGQLIGILFSSLLFGIGPYGRIIGFFVIIFYFGLLNSKIGAGQTPGKRILGIAVRDGQNQPIGLGRSLLRICLLAAPALFNGWMLPIFQNWLALLVLNFIVWGLGGAILYTMLFNQKAHQGLHDLLVGTYVVYLPGQPIESFPTTSRIHWVLSSAWLGSMAVIPLILSFIFQPFISKLLTPVEGLYGSLQQDMRFFSVGVNDQTMYGPNGKTMRILNISAWHKGPFAEADLPDLTKSLAKAVLENSKNINDYDSMKIGIYASYDIGIASGSSSYATSNSIPEWRKIIYPAGAPTGFVPALPLSSIVSLSNW